MEKRKKEMRQMRPQKKNEGDVLDDENVNIKIKRIGKIIPYHLPEPNDDHRKINIVVSEPPKEKEKLKEQTQIVRIVQTQTPEKLMRRDELDQFVKELPIQVKDQMQLLIDAQISTIANQIRKEDDSIRQELHQMKVILVFLNLISRIQ